MIQNLTKYFILKYVSLKSLLELTYRSELERYWCEVYFICTDIICNYLKMVHLIQILSVLHFFKWKPHSIVRNSWQIILKTNKQTNSVSTITCGRSTHLWHNTRLMSQKPVFTSKLLGWSIYCKHRAVGAIEQLSFVLVSLAIHRATHPLASVSGSHWSRHHD